MTRRPLCFGDDDRGQAAVDHWFPLGVIVAVAVAAIVLEKLVSSVPRPTGAETYCGGGCGFWPSEPMLVVLIILSTIIGVALYWTSTPDNTDEPEGGERA